MQVNHLMKEENKQIKVFPDTAVLTRPGSTTRYTLQAFYFIYVNILFFITIFFLLSLFIFPLYTKLLHAYTHPHVLSLSLLLSFSSIVLSLDVCIFLLLYFSCPWQRGPSPHRAIFLQIGNTKNMQNELLFDCCLHRQLYLDYLPQKKTKKT